MRVPPAGGYPGGGAKGDVGEVDRPDSSPSAARPQHLRRDPRFRRLTEQLHQLGPRPLGELLLELAHKHQIADDLLDLLEKFALLEPAAVARLDGRDWPPMPVHEAVA